MHDRESLGRWLFRHRLSVMVSAFLLALLSALAERRADPAGWFLPLPDLFGPGWAESVRFFSGLVCVASFLLRTAAEARLREYVYTQGATARIVDEGPFAVVRNPLYIGTLMFFVAAQALWAPFLVWLLSSTAFFFVLDQMVRYEEKMLGTRFGAAYGAYFERVPRWFPRLRRKSHGDFARIGHYGYAALGNLGFLSLGVYRIGVAFGAKPRSLAAMQIGATLLWLAVLGFRRLRHGGERTAPTPERVPSSV